MDHPCTPEQLLDKINGVLLGTAVGDAIGLPREGLSKKRARGLFGDKPLNHSFVLGKGMLSDDSEHTFMVTQALIASHGEPEKFAQQLSWKFRFWLLGIPAGIGLATLKSICKLWMGFSPSKSGVYSAGNGPVMRSAILGLYAGNDTDLLIHLVKSSTNMTHTDPIAYEGALIIALSAQYASDKTPEQIKPDELQAILNPFIKTEKLTEPISRVFSTLEKQISCEQFAKEMQLDKGISGYIAHTVPVVLYCWLKNKDDFRACIEETILLGGDSDTTGAIAGALAGATLGQSDIPQEWIDGIREWPRSVQWIRQLSQQLYDSIKGKPDIQPLKLFWPGLILRNCLFTGIVLFHGFRRLFPPY